MISRSLRAGQPERGRGDRVERERALEVRPGRQRSGRGVPVGDDAVALDRRAAPAREREALADDEVGVGERGVRVAVAKRAIGGDQPGRPGGGQRVDDRLERLVVDLDQLERVLGDVAVARDDDRERLAGVAGGLVCGGAVGDRAVDAGRERRGTSRPRPRRSGRRRPPGARAPPRRRGARSARGRAGERRIAACAGVRDGVEVVDVAASSPQEDARPRAAGGAVRPRSAEAPWPRR